MLEILQSVGLVLVSTVMFMLAWADVLNTRRIRALTERVNELESFKEETDVRR
jgi:hypothetical protein